MKKLYYSIGEVAKELGEPVSMVRFYTDKFSKHLSSKRTSGGNRIYTEEDIETLKGIQHLVKEKGMTLDGASLSYSTSKKKIDAKTKVLATLRALRADLVDVKKNLS